MADPLISGSVPSFANLGLAIQQAQFATLADLLKPGAMLTAQVGEPLGNNIWQVQIAGRSVVAESPTALVSGSTIQVEVQSTGPQPQLRLIANNTFATLTASDPATQLAQLGLPNEPATRSVLAAFISTGAPLVPTRLAEAAAALRLDPQQPALATAHALVARSGLPSMPLTIDLALRATQPSTPLFDVDDMPKAVSPSVAQSLVAPRSATPHSPATALPLPAFNQPVTAETLSLDLHTAGLRKTETPTAAAPHQKSAITADNPPLLPLPLARIAQALILHSDGPLAAELRTALVNSAAHTVFPPPELADYDLILPMPLREQGQSIPARLAVTTRRSGDSPAATWLRVDTKLSRLGDVSVRLAAVEHGPLTIHVVAGLHAHAALTAVLPDLEAALATKGLTASIRLSTSDD